MKVLVDNEQHKITAYNCKIDGLGPFELCPGRETKDVVGLYSLMRLVEDDTKTTIQKVMTFPNCHPDIKEGAQGQLILWEQKKDNTLKVISLNQNGIESSDLEVFYSHFEANHSWDRTGATAAILQACALVFLALVLIASVIFIFPGAIILIPAVWMIFKALKNRKVVRQIGNLAPPKAQLEQLIKQYFSEQKAAAGNSPKALSQSDQRQAVAQ
jgi:hypothetical protein